MFEAPTEEARRALRAKGVASYERGEMIDADTNLYRCATAGACLPAARGAQRVSCDASQGHSGVLCGACAAAANAAGWVRNGGGFLCAECPRWGFAVVVVLVATLLICALAVYWCMTPSRPYNSKTRPELARNPDDHSRTAVKLLMTHSQMLHALAAFTARTRVPVLGVGWWVQMMSAGITTSVSVKCAFGSQFVAPFLLTLAAPIAIPLIVALVLVPVSYAESRKRKQRKATRALGEVAPEFRARWLVSVGRAAGKRDRCIAIIAPCWPHVRLTAEEKREWRIVKEMERTVRYSPLAKLLALTLFAAWALYPSLVQVTFAALRCTEPIDGDRYMIADLTARCHTPLHILMIIASSASIAIYVLGIPVGIAALVYALRKHVRRSVRETSADAAQPPRPTLRHTCH